ncbi:hypothetical protein M752DRAFT_284606 [Aspergillus phoenicis ATCC 13157]|uniref:Uncharacterized protein n=1 Tax=Aspergillus phoenicis ATCC 13157 TaxID=1353007 RepID=A0A370PFY6_ASPPH|nr:hypothetical protein M752DRAFT_284606 [Aspergillus phoenicis ATCC 13157]
MIVGKEGPVYIASISRVDLKSFEETTLLIIDTPTITIPGCPPLWSPPKGTRKVPKDSGPLEPLFRALYTTHPSFDIGAVDLITDRNNIRKLLFFINSSLSKNGLEPFTIEMEVTGKTTIFYRAETETVRFLGPRDFIGFGHEFKKTYTRDQVNKSTGYHRIISYFFSRLRLIIRYETDGYINPLSGSPVIGMDQSKLLLRHESRTVAADLILEIKTRVVYKPISTPNLKWEESHRENLRRLDSLFKKLINIVKKSRDRLEVWIAAMVKILPDDLYSKLDYNDAEDAFYERAPAGWGPLEIMLKIGLESGYQFCFQSLPVDLTQYHTLCKTYDFLGINMVGGQTINHIFINLRACKTDYELEYKCYHAIKGEFRNEANNSVKTHNAVLFIISHPGMFIYRTRITMRAAYK